MIWSVPELMAYRRPSAVLLWAEEVSAGVEVGGAEFLAPQQELDELCASGR